MIGGPRSLQARLTWGVLAVVAALWLAMAWRTQAQARHELDELLDGHLAQAAALLVVQQAQPPDDDAPALDAPTLHRYAPRVAFQVFHEGQLVLRSAQAPLAPMAGPLARFRTGFRTVRLGQEDWRVYATFGAERDVQVYVAEQMASRAEIGGAVLAGMLKPMALALPLMALALAVVVRRGLAPLRRAGADLAARSPQSLTPLAVDAGTPAELRPMLDALNALFGRIEALMQAERRFTADAAHELRTPIAAIRTQAQVALGATDDAERHHALNATLAGCDRATRLVEQLLTLSRLEAGAPLRTQALDLGALARGVVADAAPAALARRQSIDLRSDDAAVTVQGDPTLLGVLVRNLVDNAVRHSPPGAEVHVAVDRPDGGGARLVVEDSGPGLPEADRARLGERFFRPLGTEAPGSGLGWSIVRRLAQVHGARLAVDRSARLSGLRVEVRWGGAASSDAVAQPA